MTRIFVVVFGWRFFQWQLPCLLILGGSVEEKKKKIVEVLHLDPERP